MHEIYTVIEIDAPASVVWAVLTDFEQYEEWNPMMRIEGRPVEQTTLVVQPGPEAGGIPTFKPTVVRVQPERELVWLGHRWTPGLFDGEHRFRLEDLDDGRTRLVQHERFTGILAGLVHRLTGRSTEARFEAVNEALKERAESFVSHETVFPA